LLKVVGSAGGTVPKEKSALVLDATTSLTKTTFVGHMVQLEETAAILHAPTKLDEMSCVGRII
jgi:hypothetical protein